VAHVQHFGKKVTVCPIAIARRDPYQNNRRIRILGCVVLVPMRLAMMNLRRLSAQTPALLSVIFATGIFGLLAVSGPEGIRHISAALPVDIDAPSSSIGVDLAAEPRPNSISSDDASPSERSPTEDVADTPSAPTPSAPVQLASVDPSDLEPVEADKATRSVEIGDCPVVDACVDRYLWALYQRTPKEDTIKVRDWRRVAVKRRGKRVMVSRAFTRYVDQDFGWKDPKAAERVGLPMMDYVIGGMDRSFKLKLFHMLRAAEAAGLAPGITSGFRDDYRQSIASGLKAASNRSYHGGSLRGGYGHGLAADVVSVAGGTRDRRFAFSEKLWKWVDAHGKEFGIGRPYLGRDPPHVAPVDGAEYAKHNRGAPHVASSAKTSGAKKGKRVASRDRSRPAKRPRTVAVAKLKTN
jgi:hypothetical protein